MSCALLSIGTELTRGDLHNTNSGWLAERLTTLGYEVTTMLSIDDNDDRIIEALQLLSQKHTVIICTGGLGPTTDDRTTACVARLLGVDLVRDDASLAAIKALFDRFGRGRVMSPSNEKQADFPANATVLPNSKGTAPGFMVDIYGCRSFFMPGVPREMSAIFVEQVVPRLPVRATPFTTVRLRTFGMAESEVNDRLTGVESKHGVTIGYRAHHSEIEVKVLAEARPNETHDQLISRAEAVADEVETLLGQVVYERGSARLPEVVGRLLAQKKAYLGLAESCTGGLLSEWITQVDGASRYFKGSVVSYANTAKSQILGVSELLLERHGAVSEPVVLAMAEGARRVLRCDYSVAITGVAGPSGGTKEKPVGLVHFAVSGPEGTISKKRVFFGDRTQVQHRAAMNALFMLHQYLLGRTQTD